MILITIFGWGYKPTYNWRAPSCIYDLPSDMANLQVPSKDNGGVSPKIRRKNP
jgi:hypothetical protein